ncbi:MAG TPA: hypothetical protein VGK64_10820, partial [Bryobacteraceae bacterium]
MERYLQAVKPLLPRKAQDDILRELSENIRCRMDEREADLGRPLSAAEQEEIIKEHGHPVVVAARYGRTQYLIGPAVFPFYWLILRIAAVGALIVRLVVEVVMALLSPDPAHAILPALFAVPSVLIPVFFWVTAVFAVFELCSSFFTVNWKKSWSPRSLPVVGTHSPAVSRTESVAQIIFGTAAVIWWQAVPNAPFLLLGPAASIIAPAPIWTDLHWPILLLIAAGVAQACVDLAHPQQTKGRAKIRLAIQAVGLIVLCLVLRAGVWVVMAPGVQDPARFSGVVEVLNQILFYCFLVGLIIESVRFIWRCLRQFQAHTTI